MVATGILLIGLVAVMNLFTVAVVQNANQGELATRTIEYCQDKMEQLVALSFADGSTNTTVYPSQATGGTGLGGAMAASATVGSVNPSSPVTGYVDYLNASGTLQSISTGAFYTRQWSISTDATAKRKTITVLARALISIGPGTPPSTTLVFVKSSLQ